MNSICSHVRTISSGAQQIRRSRGTRVHVKCSIRARWCLDARYGYKQDATRLLQEWVHDIGSAAGMTAANTRLSSGAIGAPESRLELEVAFNSVADWELFLSRIPFAEHKAWSQRMQAMVVDGSPRWELLRAIPLEQGTSTETSNFAAQPQGTSASLPPLQLPPFSFSPPASSTPVTARGSSQGMPAPALAGADARGSALFIPQGLGLSGMEGLLGQAGGSPTLQPSQPAAARPTGTGAPAPPPPRSPPAPAANIVHGVDLSLYPEGSEVVLDWKGDPMVIKPGDKMPKFL